MRRPAPRPARLRPTDRSALGALRRLLRETAGHATTETLIMIPVLAAIWGGIFYTHQRYGRFITMSTTTRMHVWSHAYAGCEGTPPGANTTYRENETSSDGFISGATDLLFGRGLLPGFQIDELEGRRQSTVERPTILGEGAANMGHNLITMCNEVPQADAGFFETAWRMFF